MDLEQLNIDELDSGSNNGESFADLLNTYMYEEPQRGQILYGTILEKNRDEIILDVGLKRDAIVTRKDIQRLSEELLNSLAEGQEVATYVLQPHNDDGDLIVSINKALELEDWRRAQTLMDNDEVVEASVIDSNKGGILVRFGRLTGFVPNSHLETTPTVRRDGKLNISVDKLQLKVIQVEQRRNRLILSERAARRAARNERLLQIEVGQVVKGRVVNLTDFGAFVDIGGVDGMVHISNIDHRHVNHPSDILSIGQEIDVRIDSVDIERERIALNRKAVLPDPWESFSNNYSTGELLNGVVTNVVDFGVFVAAPGGAQGLVHTSRMTSLSASTPRDMFREGDAILVRIVGIDAAQKHIELSIDDVTHEEQENWMRERRTAESEANTTELETSTYSDAPDDVYDSITTEDATTDEA